MRRSIWFFLAALLLSSCLGPKGTSTSTPDAQMVMTSVQLTVSAKLATNAAFVPSATITPTSTETVNSTITPPTTATPTTMTGITQTLTTQTGLADKAQLISQSPADQSKINAGASFKVTWTFKNMGTTTWSTAYSAKFWSDDLMGVPASVNFSKEVKPNDTIDITMNFTAPLTTGVTRTSWWLQNANGGNFFPFYIEIQVIGALPTPTVTSTIAPSQTAMPVTPTPTVTPT